MMFSASLSYADNAISSEKTFLQQDVDEYQKQAQATIAMEKSERGRKLRMTGDTFMYGQDTAIDYAEAFYWYRSAAEQGDVPAKNQLGLIFDSGGYGISKDPVKATKWFLLAADEGNGAAQVNMALRYDTRSTGHESDIQPNDRTAVNWYIKAAMQGVSIAQRNLGLHYELGLGVPQNMEEAYFWYSLSLMNGDAAINVQAAMENAALTLTKEQIEKVQSRIQVWEPTPPLSP